MKIRYSRAAASTTRVIFLLYSSTRYFLFPVENFHFRLQFLQSIDELLEFMETWDFAISFATCQPGNSSEHIHRP